MKKIVFLFAILSLAACNVYKPIAHINQFYPPTDTVELLSEPPTDFSTYFGTLKVVPADYSTPTKNDLKKAVQKITEAAKQYGANYIFIRNYDPRTSDYINVKFFDTYGGDGAVLEAELYR